jgi:DNA-binding transcriptional LysR family regulator
MWEKVELRELRVFLTLAEELHFARTAERLGLTQSRVSQSLRQLERKLAGQLIHRTSRRVALTPFGERFRGEAGAAYGQLAAVLQRSWAASDGAEGVFRLGVFEPCSAGPHLLAIVERFEAGHPDCEVHISEIRHGDDPLATLRGGEIELLAIRLPLDEPDLAVGPLLSSEPRVLAVARDHPLAARERLSIEDAADYPVTECAGVPRTIMEAFVPRATPSGRPLVRIAQSPVKPFELAALVARGKIVHPTVPSFADFYGQPGIVYVPITDLPPLRSALVWRREAGHGLLRAFIDAAREVLRECGAWARPMLED